MGVLLGAVSIAILLALLAIIRAGRSTPVTPHKRGVAVDTGHREPEAPARAAQPPSAPPAPLPDELAAFALVRTADISPARQAILLEEMERIFRAHLECLLDEAKEGFRELLEEVLHSTSRISLTKSKNPA